MDDDQTYPDIGASPPAGQVSDLPTSERQLMRALAHLVIGGSLLWAIAVAACLAQSL